MKSLFVSRTLAAGSPLRRWATPRGFRVIDRSFLRFAAVPFTAPDDAGWWFFYSSRAVDFALDRVEEPPPGVRLAAMGEGTASAITERGLTVDFTGSGSPASVAEAFATHARSQTVFFPRARQSRLTIQTLLADRITVRDAICYDNQPAPPEAPVRALYYIFTSPLNVRAYLDNWDLYRRGKVLAIGPSTAAALAEYGLRAPYPDEPTEAALVALLPN